MGCWCQQRTDILTPVFTLFISVADSRTATLDNPYISQDTPATDIGANNLAYGTNVECYLTYTIPNTDYTYTMTECIPTNDDTGANQLTDGALNPITFDSCTLVASATTATITVDPGLKIYQTGVTSIYIKATIKYEPASTRMLRGEKPRTESRALALNSATKTIHLSLKPLAFEDMLNAVATDEEIEGSGFEPDERAGNDANR